MSCRTDFNLSTISSILTFSLFLGYTRTHRSLQMIRVFVATQTFLVVLLSIPTSFAPINNILQG